MQLKEGKIKSSFIAILFFAGVVTFVVHEFSHWLAGTALGYSMNISPNQVWSKSPILPWHALMVSAAGPVVTYVQAFIGYYKIKNYSSLIGFAFLYMAFFTRLLAMAVSLFNPNDEARISRNLGVGMWTIPSIVVSILFVMVFISSKRLKLTFRDQLVCYLIASIVVSSFVGADYFLFSKA